jgi:hypothetical protein
VAGTMCYLCLRLLINSSKWQRTIASELPTIRELVWLEGIRTLFGTDRISSPLAGHSHDPIATLIDAVNPHVLDAQNESVISCVAG